MVKLIAGRVLLGLVTIVILSFVIQVGIALLPGDPARTVAGGLASDAQVETIRQALDINHPILVQYTNWLRHAIGGDLGFSYTQGSPFSAASRVPVSQIIGTPTRNSLILAGCAGIVLYPLAVVLGTLSARHRGGTLDNIIGGVTLAFISTPEFVIGLTAVLIFAIWVHAFPAVSLAGSASSFGEWAHLLVLPAGTICLVFLAQTTRICRAAVIDTLESEYVQFARLKGLRERTVVLQAMRNSLGPAVQAMGLNFGYLLGGVVVIEQVFGFPGLGTVLLTAVQGHDDPTVVAATLVIATIFICANLLAELAAIGLNPRLRSTASRRAVRP